jgi:hypothetical protein
MMIPEPYPGNWFAVAFISWTDPNNERIEQQGKYNGDAWYYLKLKCQLFLIIKKSFEP